MADELTKTDVDRVDGRAVPPRLKAVFFLRSINYDRVFESLLRALLERGHEVLIALDREKGGLPEDKTHLFDGLSERYPRFAYRQLPPRSDTWLVPATAIRRGLDYLRYLEPEYAHADPLRNRARERASRVFRALLVLPPFRWRFGRRLLAWPLRRLEAAIPIPRTVKSFISDQAPDVVLVSPLVDLGSAQGDYVRAAEAARIPTVLAVASWDNLTNKGVIRDLPTLTIVWNQTQVEEAVRLHRLPRERVAAVGAHTFDHWFGWRPAATREQFTAKLGLDSERPLMLYLGSSRFITANETGFIREWLSRVREHPRLRDTAVLLRPHPQNVIGWQTAGLEEPGRTVVWPPAGAAPTGAEKKRDYFESLYHSRAVFGINTSALIEAAIVRRPVLTLVSNHFGTQDGTLHFAYLAGEGEPGMLIVGRTWEEHLDQLADAVETPNSHTERLETFLAHFVRPRGLDAPAAPIAVEAIERAAATEVASSRRGRFLRPILRLLTPIVAAVLPLLHPRRTARVVMKAVRRAVKWIRRRAKMLRRTMRGRRRGERARQRQRLRAERRREGTKASESGTPRTAPRATKAEKARALEEKARAREEKAKVRAAKEAKARAQEGAKAAVDRGFREKVDGHHNGSEAGEEAPAVGDGGDQVNDGRD